MDWIHDWNLNLGRAIEFYTSSFHIVEYNIQEGRRVLDLKEKEGRVLKYYCGTNTRDRLNSLTRKEKFTTFFLLLFFISSFSFLFGSSCLLGFAIIFFYLHFYLPYFRPESKRLTVQTWSVEYPRQIQVASALGVLSFISFVFTFWSQFGLFSPVILYCCFMGTICLISLF